VDIKIITVRIVERIIVNSKPKKRLITVPRIPKILPRKQNTSTR
jgi:hypothetical protein